MKSKDLIFLLKKAAHICYFHLFQGGNPLILHIYPEDCGLMRKLKYNGSTMIYGMIIWRDGDIFVSITLNNFARDIARRLS